MPKITVGAVFYAICSAIGTAWSIIQFLEWLSARPLPSLLFQLDRRLIVSVLLMLTFPLWLAYRKLYPLFQDFAVGLSGRHRDDFLVGETVRFEARFRGELKNGFFTCKLRPPEHTTLPDSNEDYVWWANYKTYDEPRDLGLLNVRGSTRFLLFWKAHRSVWGNKIPFNYPAGKYRANIEVYNGDERGKPLRSIEMTFTVKHEELVPLLGWKAGAFVRTPTFH
jgi:hypothetical protein